MFETVRKSEYSKIYPGNECIPCMHACSVMSGSLRPHGLQPARHGVPFRASLYLHVVNSHISFQIFFAKCFLGVLQAGKARCVCVSVCITAHNKRITEFFFLIFKRFCYIFNPSGIHFNFGVGKKSNIIFLIASCPHTIITYQLIYSWICF